MPPYQLIGHFAISLAVLGALVALGRYRQLGPALRLVALLVCFDAATELTVVAFSYWLHKSSLFLFPVSLGGEGLLLTLAYRRVLAAPLLGRVLVVVVAGYLAFLLVDAWLKLGTVQYFVAAQVVCNLLMLGLAALYFRRLLHELHVPHLGTDPFFWVSVGLVVYALGNLLIALSSDYVLAHYSEDTQYFVLRGLRNVFNAALYSAYLVALCVRPPKPSS